MSNARSIRRLIFALGVALPAAASAGIVVPGAYAKLPGGQSNGFPINSGGLGLPAERVQQLYAAATLGATRIMIYGIAFRPGALGVFKGTLPSLGISLSTSRIAIGVGEDEMFADYIGADATAVFNGALKIKTAGRPFGGAPGAFDIVIHFATPFTYDRARAICSSI